MGMGGGLANDEGQDSHHHRGNSHMPPTGDGLAANAQSSAAPKRSLRGR